MPQLSRSSKNFDNTKHTPLIQLFSSPVFCLGRLQSTSWIFWRPRAESEHQGTSGLCSFGKFPKIQSSIDFNRFQQISMRISPILGPSFFLLNATAFSMVDGTPCRELRGQLRIELGAERLEWMGMDCHGIIMGFP